MTNIYLDSHCHLSLIKEPLFLKQVIQDCEEKNVKEFFMGGYYPEDWVAQAELAVLYPKKFMLSFGLHPWFICSSDQEKCEAAFSMLKNCAVKANAIGEMGLDTFHEARAQLIDRQILFFEKQLRLAVEYKKPLVLHVVREHGRVMDRLIESQHAQGGMVHAFSGSYQNAKKYVDLGYLISVGPAILKGGYEGLKESVENLPLENICIESDSPDKKHSTPHLILEVAKRVAEMKNVVGGKEVVLLKSCENVKKIFGDCLETTHDD